MPLAPPLACGSFQVPFSPGVLALACAQRIRCLSAAGAPSQSSRPPAADLPVARKRARKPAVALGQPVAYAGSGDLLTLSSVLDRHDHTFRIVIRGVEIK